jgi:lycopene cyclase domain-containing protein
MQVTYLAALILSLCGLAMLDWRFKLAYWENARATVLTLASSVAIFAVWDVAGIRLNIFLHGDSKYALPFTLVSEFPVEEVFFLLLLVYVTLLLWRGSERQWPRT